MKSYNEMAKSALRRIDEENKKLIKRKKVLKRTLIPTLSLCLTAVIGVSVMGGFGIKVAPEIEESYYVEYEGAVDTNVDTTGKLTGNETEVAVGGSARPNDQNGGIQSNGQTTASSYTYIIDIFYEGKVYSYTESEDASLYEKDKLLGGASTFVGYYKPEYIDGKVYSVKNSSEFLLLELDDGKAVLLKEIK